MIHSSGRKCGRLEKNVDRNDQRTEDMKMRVLRLRENGTLNKLTPVLQATNVTVDLRKIDCS